MPDFLALDWEHRQVCGLDAEVTPAGIRVRKAFSLTWPAGKSPDVDAPAAGGWLNEQFQLLGLTAKQVIVTLPREDAIVRVLEVPNVPDGELPNVVKFQAAVKSTRSLDTMLLDFVPLPAREGVAGREVLVATIGKEVIDPLRLVLSRTGCELIGLTLTAPAMLELIARLDRTEPKPNTVELAIVQHGKRVEISLLRQRSLLLTHSAQLPDDATDPERERQAVVAEINRSLVSLKRQHSDLNLSRAWLWGDAIECQELSNVLAKRFQIDVRVADPLSLPGVFIKDAAEIEAHALFTGPVGILLAQSNRQAEGMDFLRPRQQVIPRDLRKLFATAVTAAAVVIIAGAFLVRAIRLNRLQNEINDTITAVKDLDSSLKGSKDSVTRADSIQKWIDQRVPWLDRLNELAAINDGTAERYVTKLTCQPGTSGSTASLRGIGFAKDRDDVERLTAQLTGREGYVVVPHAIGKGPDGDYPVQFDLDISWKPAAKEKPKATNSKSADKSEKTR